mmetsp:Transcript_7763/g.11379  ORF Transcript_7763/g.11379 Transcript_7763/m.11379 type:complete len:387 (-) Transcript_7763:31-1191(-)
MRAGRHPPQRCTGVIHGVVAFGLWLYHIGGKGGVPEDLLGNIALCQSGQRLVKVIRGSTGRCVFTQPFVPFADRIDRGRAVCSTTTGNTCARRITRAGFHTDAPLIDWHAVWLTFGTGTGHREPGVGHPPAKVRRAFAVIHVAVDCGAVDFFDVFAKELGDVLIGRPVDRNAQIIAVFCLKGLLQVCPVKPVLAEPVEVGKLLIGQLVKIAIRTRGELGAHEIFEVETGVGLRLEITSHHIREVMRQLQPRVGADQIRVIDIGIIKIALRLHLGLNRLYHFALAEDLVVHLDTGDFFKGFGQHFRFIGMRRDAFGEHVDLHALEGLGCGHEPLHLTHLFVFGQDRGLKFLIDPFACGCLISKSRLSRSHGAYRCCGQKIPAHLFPP